MWQWHLLFSGWLCDLWLFLVEGRGKVKVKEVVVPYVDDKQFTFCWVCQSFILIWFKFLTCNLPLGQLNPILFYCIKSNWTLKSSQVLKSINNYPWIFKKTKKYRKKKKKKIIMNELLLIIIIKSPLLNNKLLFKSGDLIFNCCWLK